MPADHPYIFKRTFLNYIDIGIAILNFLVIVFPLIVFYQSILISFIGVGVAGFLIIITLNTFIKNNPFYMYYCYALVLSSLFFFWRLLQINAVFGFGILPMTWYIYTFYVGNEIYAPDLAPYNNSINLFSNRIPKRFDGNIAYKRKQRIERIKKQYNSDLSRKYSFILARVLLSPTCSCAQPKMKTDKIIKHK